MPVNAIDHVGLMVPDLDASFEFYVERWGLTPVDGDATRTQHFLRTTSSPHHALCLLAAPPGRQRAEMSYLGLSVSCREDLEVAVGAAEAAGGMVERTPGDAIAPGHRYSAAVRDPDGNHVELVSGSEVSTQRSAPQTVTPRKLGHVVLNTPQRPALERFYACLGLKVCDRTAIGMSFLRCNHDHHSLALVDSERTGVQHLAFDVVTMDNVMIALGQLGRGGVPCVWGPGRHGPGDNVFTYYRDPGGVFVEYYAELQQVADIGGLLEPRFWGPEWKGDIWRLAGPPPPNFTS